MMRRVGGRTTACAMEDSSCSVNANACGRADRYTDFSVSPTYRMQTGTTLPVPQTILSRDSGTPRAAQAALIPLLPRTLATSSTEGQLQRISTQCKPAGTRQYTVSRAQDYYCPPVASTATRTKTPLLPSPKRAPSKTISSILRQYGSFSGESQKNNTNSAQKPDPATDCKADH